MSRLAARYLMEVKARQLSNEWLHRSFKSQLRWINTLKFHAFTLNHFSTHSVYLNGGGTLRLKRWKKILKAQAQDKWKISKPLSISLIWMVKHWDSIHNCTFHSTPFKTTGGIPKLIFTKYFLWKFNYPGISNPELTRPMSATLATTL